MTLKGLYAKEGRQNDVRITGKKKKNGMPCTQGIQKPDQRLRRCDLDHESTERAGNIASMKSSEGENGARLFVSPLTLP